jgi:hypothetical protein
MLPMLRSKTGSEADALVLVPIIKMNNVQKYNFVIVEELFCCQEKDGRPTRQGAIAAKRQFAC